MFFWFQFSSASCHCMFGARLVFVPNELEAIAAHSTCCHETLDSLLKLVTDLHDAASCQANIVAPSQMTQTFIIDKHKHM